MEENIIYRLWSLEKPDVWCWALSVKSKPLHLCKRVLALSPGIGNNQLHNTHFERARARETEKNFALSTTKPRRNSPPIFFYTHGNDERLDRNWPGNEGKKGFSSQARFSELFFPGKRLWDLHCRKGSRD
ncbi:hypothetical protein MRB53_029934 [Persea americana]|uniref:Uncharacterized protein n=1 Tax=Persea americana TaxID=3435 RepID=A0ACC2KJS4_PERAE|nr:hypothetical protein MRB53_029934 [Persea americana]